MKNLRLIRFPVLSSLFLLIPVILFTAAGCKGNINDGRINVEIVNNTDSVFTDLVVEFSDTNFINKLRKFDSSKLLVQANGMQLPFQVIYKNGKIEQILLLCNIEARQKLLVGISQGDSSTIQSFAKRTQAELSVKEEGKWEQVKKKNGTQQFEYKGGTFSNVNYLRVPDNHTDHSFYIRYEGPGWESDKVGYRFYLDWRNAVDIFGKQTTNMVLQQVGQDGFESYHAECDWGMDILKVGNSLGIGSIGYWDGNNAIRVAVTDSIECKIEQNGNIRSAVKTKYYGWKDAGTNVNLKSRISIDAGSHLSFQQVFLSADIGNICTGIVKDTAAETIVSKTDNGPWTYFATFGRQSLNNDNLGMVIFYRKADLIELTGDLHSHVLVLRPVQNKLIYYFGAVWEKDVDRISNKEQFSEYLERVKFCLNNLVSIKYQ